MRQEMNNHNGTLGARHASSPGPTCLWIVRHGESEGNLARFAAEARGEAAIRLSVRDADIELSELGVRQARALGRWLVATGRAAHPTVVLTSPYRRSSHTARIIVDQVQPADFPDPIVDERLREREFGILDHLTRIGIEGRFPEQAWQMTNLGKFYHRPPGGESWCDVILRLRSWFDSLCREFPDGRVVVVCHSMVVLCLRYLLERLDETALLEIDAAEQIANCGVTCYRRVSSSHMPAGLERESFNWTAPMEEAGEPVTTKPDLPKMPA